MRLNQKFQYKAEVMTMQPRKRSARTALYPPAILWTPVLGCSCTQPTLDGISCSTVKGCNLFQPALSFPGRANTSVETQVCRCAKDWTGKATHVLIFSPRLILTQSFVQGTHHTQVCASTHSQCRDRACLFTLSAAKQSQGYPTAIGVTNLCVHMHKLFRWQWTYSPKNKRKLSNWSNYKHCHERITDTFVLLKCQSM